MGGKTEMWSNGVLRRGRKPCGTHGLGQKVLDWEAQGEMPACPLTPHSPGDDLRSRSFTARLGFMSGACQGDICLSPKLGQGDSLIKGQGSSY